MFFHSEVRGASMMTYLNPYWHYRGDTDSVLVSRHRNPQHGDIVVMRFYHMGGEHQGNNGPFDFFIKRVIGMGNDTIYISAELNIYVNNERLDESAYLHIFWGENVRLAYLRNWIQNPSSSGWQGRHIRRRYYYDDYGNVLFHRNEVHVQCRINPDEQMFFFLGDNRRASTDSAAHGPSPVAHISGVVVDVIHDQGLVRYIGGWILDIVTLRFIWGRNANAGVIV